MRQVLCAGVRVAEMLHVERSAVLVHCSDGWDRTAQIVLLTQLLLDPACRTLRGFCTLLDKELVRTPARLPSVGISTTSTISTSTAPRPPSPPPPSSPPAARSTGATSARSGSGWRGSRP